MIDFDALVAAVALTYLQVRIAVSAHRIFRRWRDRP